MAEISAARPWIKSLNGMKNLGGIKKFTGRTGSTVLGMALIVAISTVLPLIMLQYPLFLQAEQWTRDYRIYNGPIADAPDPNVVVVTITEQVVAPFTYQSPVDREFLSSLLQTLAKKHVRAIGLDVLFDTPTEPAKDALLRQTLRHLPMPIVVSYVTDPRLLVSASGYKYLQAFVPPESRGMASVPSDGDGTIRRIWPGQVAPDGQYIPGLARAILQRLGIQTPAEEVTIAYRGLTKYHKEAISQYPANAISFLPDAFFKDKIVLVGADYKLIDRHRTPFAIYQKDIDGAMPGVVIHAQGLAQLLEGRSPSDLSMTWSVVLIAGMAAAATLLGFASIPIWALIMSFTALLMGLVVAALKLYNGLELFIPVVPPALGLVIAAIITDQIVGRQFRKQRNYIQGAMGRYVSPKVVLELLANPDRLSLSGTRREMSFLFTDVASFTSMAEAIGSERLTALLNQYLTGLCKIIEERDGTVCRFIGDAVFALWNAPVEQPDHYQRAADCALAIDAYAESYAAEQRALGVPFGHTRIGVHSGEAMVGNFGSPQRMEYTALGDNVNLSARLESVNKFFGTRISMSETVVQNVSNIHFRHVARVTVKGKTLPMGIYEPWPQDQVESGFAERYRIAYALLTDEDPGTREAFEKLAEENPTDGCVRFHLDRLRKGEHGTKVKMDEK